jgi:hypothetical protein
VIGCDSASIPFGEKPSAASMELGQRREMESSGWATLGRSRAVMHAAQRSWADVGAGPGSRFTCAEERGRPGRLGKKRKRSSRSERRKSKEEGAGQERKKKLGRQGIGPRRLLENSKDFSIYYYDSNSNLIRILNEFYSNLKLKHSIESK